MGLKGTNGDRRKEISKRFRPQCAVLVSDEERLTQGTGIGSRDDCPITAPVLVRVSIVA
jgi:hypothetical protein